MRRRAKRDTNEAEIVQALRKVGAEVQLVSCAGCPDILAIYQGRTYGMEVKSATGKRTKAQQVSLWPIVRSVEDALAVIGVAA